MVELYQKIALGVAVLTVLTAGFGSIFNVLERDTELQRYQKNRFFYKQMEELWRFDKCDEPPYDLGLEWCKNQDKFAVVLKDFFDRTGNEMTDAERWTFFGSSFFVYTLGTSLGYGSLHPETAYGKLLTVLTGLVTIPIGGYVLSLIANFFVLNFNGSKNPLVTCFSFFVFFTFLGGILYSQVFEEPWTFTESVYFSAGTLFTIGFGDYFPAGVASKVFTMFFIFCGLGVTACFVALTVSRLDAFVVDQLQLAQKKKHQRIAQRRVDQDVAVNYGTMA